MNRSFHNIEYKPWPGKTYRVGYAPISGVWWIRKAGKGYVAFCRTDRAVGVGCFMASTLAEVSAKLAEN